VHGYARHAFEALATAGLLLLLLPGAASGLQPLLLLLPAMSGPWKWRRLAQSAYLRTSTKTQQAASYTAGLRAG
jgi:UPF0716 family protein affecting phage T7 exclusion